jgi:hypothetical protein
VALLAAGALSFTPLYSARHVRLVVTRSWRNNLQPCAVDTLLRMLTSANDLERMELCLPFHTLGTSAWRHLKERIQTQWPRLRALSLTVCAAENCDCVEVSGVIVTAITHLPDVTFTVPSAKLLPFLTTHQTDIQVHLTNVCLLVPDIGLCTMRMHHGAPRCERLNVTFRTTCNPRAIQYALYALCHLPLVELCLTFTQCALGDAERLMPPLSDLMLTATRSLCLDVANTALTTLGLDNVASWALALPQLRDLTVKAPHNQITRMFLCGLPARLRHFRIDLRGNPLRDSTGSKPWNDQIRQRCPPLATCDIRTV